MAAREAPDHAARRSRRGVLAMLTTVLAAAATCAEAAGQPARIGLLTVEAEPPNSPFMEALRRGLAEFGYAERRDYIIEPRAADDAPARVPALARELAALPVDLIVARGGAAFAIRNLGLPVPTVYAVSADPVSAGFAESLARPGGNMTGLTFMAFEFAGKRLELLRDLVPGVRRVAIIGNPEHSGTHLERAFSEETAAKLGMALTFLPTSTAAELDLALAGLDRDPPQALSVLADAFASRHRHTIMAFAMRQNIPVISGWPVYAEAGALCTYGPRLSESYRRLAHYVVRVLKGAKPSDLPIERPANFELVINLRTAKTLGLEISAAMAARADDLIE